MATKSLHDLPPELMLEICQQLGPKDMIRICIASECFYEILQANTVLQHKFYVLRYPIGVHVYLDKFMGVSFVNPDNTRTYPGCLSIPEWFAGATSVILDLYPYTLDNGTRHLSTLASHPCANMSLTYPPVPVELRVREKHVEKFSDSATIGDLVSTLRRWNVDFKGQCWYQYFRAKLLSDHPQKRFGLWVIT